MVVDIANSTLLDLNARHYEEAQHRALIAKGIKESCATWFCCDFCPVDPDILAVGSSAGDIRLYSVTALTRARSSKSTPPHLLSISAHKGPAYGLTFATLPGADQPLLLSCGDDGAVRGWRWDHLQAAAGSSEQPQVTPQFEAAIPPGSLGTTPELNALCVDSTSGRLYAGGGSGVCCSWDLTTGAAAGTMQGLSRDSGVLSAALHGSLLATGSTDGTVSVWDTRTHGRLHLVAPKAGGKQVGVQPFTCWPVRCLRFDTGGNWLVAGAGAHLHPWSMCAATPTDSIHTETNSQALVMEPNRMLVAGDEASMRRYDFRGRLLSKVATGTVCTYGLARNKSTGVVCMAGSGGRVDIFTDNGSKIGGLC